MKTSIEFLIIILFLVSSSLAQQKVYVAFIEGDIDLGIAPYVSRVVSDAEDAGADAIVFKINTFDGDCFLMRLLLAIGT